jgi:hypothetical protein
LWVKQNWTLGYSNGPEMVDPSEKRHCVHRLAAGDFLPGGGKDTQFVMLAYGLDRFQAMPPEYMSNQNVGSDNSERYPGRGANGYVESESGFPGERWWRNRAALHVANDRIEQHYKFGDRGSVSVSRQSLWIYGSKVSAD